MINAKVIENAVYDLCVQANTVLPQSVVQKVLEAYTKEQNENAKEVLAMILKNAKMADEKKMPLCQDTGQVMIFVRGKCFPNGYTEAINKGVERAYAEHFFRKSIVKNALFDRTNTKTNTPCIIYTEPSDSEDMEIKLLIKGAGSENVSSVRMMSPTSTEEEVVDFVVSEIKKAGSKACPPYFLGVGIGGTMEYAGILSKKALILEQDIDEKHAKLAQKIQSASNELPIGPAGLGGPSTMLGVKVLSDFTHIACMPVALTLSCHSFRHAKCIITKDGSIQIEKEHHAASLPTDIHLNNYIKIHTSEVEKMRNLKQGQKILLSGEIYSARDMAHKRIAEMIAKGEQLPFELEDKIIFFAGPCPCKDPCVVGSIGPTTASRMDKYAKTFYEKGLLATIGKGERSDEAKKVIKQNHGLYFAAVGGVACFLSERFIKKELIAFEDLGTEAINKFEVSDFPLIVNFK